MDVLVLLLIAQIRSMCHRPFASLIRENKSFTISSGNPLKKTENPIFSIFSILGSRANLIVLFLIHFFSLLRDERFKLKGGRRNCSEIIPHVSKYLKSIQLRKLFLENDTSKIKRFVENIDRYQPQDGKKTWKSIVCASTHSQESLPVVTANNHKEQLSPTSIKLMFSIS